MVLCLFVFIKQLVHITILCKSDECGTMLHLSLGESVQMKCTDEEPSNTFLNPSPCKLEESQNLSSESPTMDPRLTSIGRSKS